jgi:hypothetical protein
LVADSSKKYVQAAEIYDRHAPKEVDCLGRLSRFRVRWFRDTHMGFEMDKTFSADELLAIDMTLDLDESSMTAACWRWPVGSDSSTMDLRRQLIAFGDAVSITIKEPLTITR